MKTLESEYYITSKLADDDVQALEELFYFNPNQWKLRESVEAAIGRFGTPRMTKSEGNWRMVLSGIGEAQTLYLYKAGNPQILSGVLLYIRDRHILRVLFWGLHPDHTFHSAPEKYLLLEMVDALKNLAKRVVGIEMISFRFGSRDHHLRI